MCVIWGNIVGALSHNIVMEWMRGAARVAPLSPEPSQGSVDVASEKILKL